MADQGKLIGAGIQTGVGLLALVSGRGGISETAAGIKNLLSAADVIPDEGGEEGKKKTDDKKAPVKTENKDEPATLTPEQKAAGLKIVQTAIQQAGGVVGGGGD